MRRGVLVQLAAVVGARHHATVAHDDGSYGHLVLRGRRASLFERQPHEALVQGAGLCHGRHVLLVHHRILAYVFEPYALGYIHLTTEGWQSG